MLPWIGIPIILRAIKTAEFDFSTSTVNQGSNVWCRKPYFDCVLFSFLPYMYGLEETTMAGKGRELRQSTLFHA